MRKPAIIKTPPLTVEDVARSMRMPRSRAKELLALTDSIVARRPPKTKQETSKRSAASEKRAAKTEPIPEEKVMQEEARARRSLSQCSL